MEHIRTFVAVDLGEELKSTIGRAQQQWDRQVKGFKWVDPANYHITVRFIGSINKSRLPSLKKAIEKAVAGTPPFTMSLKGFGSFPYRSNPRVIWVGVGEGEDFLQQLWNDVESELVGQGFTRADREFSPHLTVGRAKANRNRGDLTSFFNRLKSRYWGDMTVSTVTLFESELNKSGPTYTAIKEFELTDDDSA